MIKRKIVNHIVNHKVLHAVSERVNSLVDNNVGIQPRLKIDVYVGFYSWDLLGSIPQLLRNAIVERNTHDT